jgi:hypothetical protein
MRMLLLYAVLFVFLSVSFGQVVVEVNKESATLQDAKLLFSRDFEPNANANVNANVKNSADHEKIIDQLVATQLLFIEAKKEKLESDPDYISLLESYKKLALIDLYIQKVLKPKITVSDSELVQKYKSDPRYYRPSRLKVNIVMSPMETPFDAALAKEALNSTITDPNANMIQNNSPSAGKDELYKKLSTSNMSFNSMEFREDDYHLQKMPKLWTEKEGTISEVIEFDGRKMMVKVMGKTKDESVPMSEVKDALTEDIRREKLEGEKRKLIAELKKTAVITIHNETLNSLW